MTITIMLDPEPTFESRHLHRALLHMFCKMNLKVELLGGTCDNYKALIAKGEITVEVIDNAIL